MKPAIINIPGIGPAAVETLDEHDIKSLAALANASAEKITTITGFSEACTVRILAAANELLVSSGTIPSAKDKGKKSGKKDESAGKGKKGKKSKGQGQEIENLLITGMGSPLKTILHSGQRISQSGATGEGISRQLVQHLLP